MARQIQPSFAAQFRSRVRDALQIAQAGEIVRARRALGHQTHTYFHHHRIEMLYEMAFLRVFVAWESFLEDVFLRYLAGFATRNGSVVYSATFAGCANLTQAESTMLGNRPFVLWHDPRRVVSRCQGFFQQCPMEGVFLSDFQRLDGLSKVRHRIAHSQKNARVRFDQMTLLTSGRSYLGGRAGAFLRDTVPNTQPIVRWLDKLSSDLVGLSTQID